MMASDIYSQLIAVFVDWRGVLKDPQYIRRGNEITWSNAVHAILPDKLTRAETIELSRSGQFTFRISEDDSILQISYVFAQTGDLECARLAYYQVGSSYQVDEAIDVYPSEDEPSDTPINWIRFDYVRTQRRRVLHMDSHLHVSGLPGMRIAVEGVPTPKQFVEFVISHFYANTYESFRLHGDQQFISTDQIDQINSERITLHRDVAIYRRVPHVKMP
jgi:hypothetical protein